VTNAAGDIRDKSDAVQDKLKAAKILGQIKSIKHKA
jgi:hypothetical protein